MKVALHLCGFVTVIPAIAIEIGKRAGDVGAFLAQQEGGEPVLADDLEADHFVRASPVLAQSQGIIGGGFGEVGDFKRDDSVSVDFFDFMFYSQKRAGG